ncbi:MAG: histidine phosphatase family protein [Spirochaetales bacterium]|uniref:Histidine phosphatase family protein n=1 Tax=Candidatus Thalassospirochaeta sargassi TaxID=3119039 RepID=A0AAJ1IH28_9SPIO|nr:histidine phosphatase family protein [Spirochaetales bacterium]
MAELVLIRHGEAVGQGGFNGRRTDPPLSDTGRARAESLRERMLCDGLLPTGNSRLLVSPMCRAAETAEIVFGEYLTTGLKRETVDEFAEVDFGEWDGLNWAQIKKTDEAAFDSWLENPVDISPPGGESLSAFDKRVMQGLERALSDAAGADCASEQKPDNSRIYITAHGGVIRSIICLLLKLPSDRHLSFQVDCASCSIVSTYRAEDGSVSAVLSKLNIR